MPLRLPSRLEAWQRLRAAAPPEWVFRHVACVEALAMAMAQQGKANGQRLDVHLVQIGAILHDLGRSVTQDPTHAHIGAELLRKEDAVEALVNIVERHTGAGLEPAAARGLGLPPGQYIPETLEERIVAHADNLYSGDKRLDLAQVLTKYEAKGLAEAGAAISVLHQDLESLLGCDLDTLESSALPPV